MMDIGMVRGEQGCESISSNALSFLKGLFCFSVLAGH